MLAMPSTSSSVLLTGYSDLSRAGQLISQANLQIRQYQAAVYEFSNAEAPRIVCVASDHYSRHPLCSKY